MPNYCHYTMRVRGSYEAIDEMERRLTDYDHTPHFWRVFEADRVDEPSRQGDGSADMVAEFDGTCAWSVNACMCDGPLTYAGDFSKNPETAPCCTSLAKTAEELGIDIEVFSEEPGMGFAEHYRYLRGEAPIEEETEYREIFWDRYEHATFAEFDEACGVSELGLTEEDFHDEDGEEYAIIGGYERNWAF